MRLTFPPELPITAHLDEIVQAIQKHQVVIVCGDTGSGKTTQLPKIVLHAGRGERGLIGCTQPRRLATLAMARRVAEEFGSQPGEIVGYQHRFETNLSDATRIKFMTDGILLAETRHDRLFRKYDTLIIDEAHERSLNIDFLLGILKLTLPRRPDLKLIISSATLDVKRFSDFFDHAPVISVPGRLYPIETRWRPAEEGDEIDLPRQIANAVDELATENEGDILVFLPGERDIREATEVLTGRRLPHTEIIPLLASLPAGEQQRAFKTSSNRRIILSTNVAETSVTLPGIRSVIDSGLVRLSRYNPRTQVQRLQVEPTSQASANQRKGRCGRIAPGVCIRLYSEEDFAKRDDYTPPEILRSSLAQVILTMMDLKLGNIEDFPFIDPPSNAAIREGYRELALLQAIEEVAEGPWPWRLTSLGRQLVRLPIEPALARMLFIADHEAALADTLTVVAGLECDDPRRRPMDNQADADKCHAQFLTQNSDFSAMLRLWRWYREKNEKGSQSALRRLCKENYLSFPRMRDWSDLRDQLEHLCKTLKLDVTSTTGGEIGLHKALLAGLLANVGHRDPEMNDYRGTRTIRFSLFPGSGLVRIKQKREEHPPRHMPRTAKGPPQLPTSRDWVIAGELVETSRLFARTAACIDPQWIEPLARAQCKYSYHSAQWDPVNGFVRVRERVTFYGLVLVESRVRDLSRINPVEARTIFIREGLIQGALPAPIPPVIHSNLNRISTLLTAEAKTRQHGMLFNPDLAFAFYDARIPPDICSAQALRTWLKTADSDVLLMRDSDLPPARDLTLDFPDSILINGNRLQLTYRNAQGESDDGITCTVPAHLLNQVAAWRSDWLVPGMLDEKLRWMLNALPSKIRRLLLPYDETLAQCCARLHPGKSALTTAFAEAIYAVRGIRVPTEQWRDDALPDHLRMRFVVCNDADTTLGSGRNIDALAKLFGQQHAPSTARDAQLQRWQRTGITHWDFGDLPAQIDVGKAGWPIIHYPALVDQTDSVALQLFAEAGQAATTHERGVCRLAALALGKESKRYFAAPSLPRDAQLYLTTLESTPAELGDEIGRCIFREVLIESRPVVRTAAVFAERLAAAKGLLHSVHLMRTRMVTAILQTASELTTLLSRTTLLEVTHDDIEEQLAWLVFPSFAETIDTPQLNHLPRYLEAIRMRIERAKTNPATDLRKRSELEPHWKRYVEFLDKEPRPIHDSSALQEYRWLVEEYRVSLFAQELRTPVAVSAKRLNQLWDKAISPM